MSEPKKVDINTWYVSGPVFRCELVMTFASEEEAKAMDSSIVRIKQAIANGDTPHTTFKLWTERAANP